MARPGGLGKGLGALIPSDATERGGAATAPGLQELPIAAIRPNPYQPRDRFDEEGIGALADSIREVGLLQPCSSDRRATATSSSPASAAGAPRTGPGSR